VAAKRVRRAASVYGRALPTLRETAQTILRIPRTGGGAALDGGDQGHGNGRGSGVRGDGGGRVFGWKQSRGTAAWHIARGHCGGYDGGRTISGTVCDGDGCRGGGRYAGLGEGGPRTNTPGHEMSRLEPGGSCNREIPKVATPCNSSIYVQSPHLPTSLSSEISSTRFESPGKARD